VAANGATAVELAAEVAAVDNVIDPCGWHELIPCRLEGGRYGPIAGAVDKMRCMVEDEGRACY